ncbi:MAG TPA: zinc ribbon domain-containing protein [Candidatus Polarisedimenticolia bacterium]|nr:zinc ribbon domain-containing protein [Candidatus Polarisedimenticolia bacterium]
MSTSRTSLKCSAQFIRWSVKTQADFACTSCGHTDNADHNGAVNILARNEPLDANPSRVTLCVGIFALQGRRGSARARIQGGGAHERGIHRTALRSDFRHPQRSGNRSRKNPQNSG